ncbi:hypothetical protein OBBRIDRAFT_787851 [Obba rivulosa]|uniref:Velvet domain-containing protein n=1 Tax=Obba rivulosa TaxID=1052685 RepID=A0A8E2DUP2_9APHY|nr:hypothetical protein OBBRIDRAFT_787851 [Obba rivulosa]
MIQKTNARTGSTAIAPSRQASSSDGPESWGQWVGRKHYSLEVVQNPIRARMCGFGDKDRRPLAPAAVAKMIVRREDNSLVDVDDIDCSFFLVTVDLWSADGKHEMNLVLHPTSADRYVPSSTPKSNKRRATNPPAQPSQRSDRSSPVPVAPPPPNPPQYPQQSSGMTPFMTPTTPGYPAQAYPFPSQQGPVPESSSFTPISPYGPPESHGPNWGYAPSTSAIERVPSYGPPALPSIQPVSRNPSASGGSTAGPGFGASAQTGGGSGEPWPLENSGRDEPEGMSYRPWSQDSFHAPMDNNSMPPPPGGVESPVRLQPAPNSNQELRDTQYSPVAPTSTTEAYSQPRYSQEPYAPATQQSSSSAPQLDTSMYASASYAQQQHHQHAQSQPHYQQGSYVPEPTPPSTIPPLPRHTYTRTLVGPLCSNACRLLDEHRKPGIFFLFQDLSIRTEGTFRLRLRLMNVGAPPAPEPGAVRVHTDVSPVLAQTFTESFTVYSAKRFPGVPDTTALSIALGNQGQKLPLRNRNGSTKQGRKRQRSGSAGSGDDSDEA